MKWPCHNNKANSFGPLQYEWRNFTYKENTHPHSRLVKLSVRIELPLTLIAVSLLDLWS